MLRRLRVDNFKSLINVEIEPSALNLVIGPNNSGKTNLCQALNFLSTTAQVPLDQAVATVSDPWLFTNAYLNNPEVTFECDCDLTCDGDGLSYSYKLVLTMAEAPHLGPRARDMVVEHETLSVTGGRFGSKTAVLENRAGNVRLLHEGRHAAGETDAYVETAAPTSGTMLHRLYDLRHNRAANAFKSYLADWRYYDLDTSKLRDTRSHVPARLMPDGSNLSLVLYQLKNLRERDYRRLLEVVQAIEPHLDALNFVPPSSQDSILMFMTDERSTLFTLRALSNGTLRFLALAYVLLFEVPEQRLIVIEEPETGIYVGYLKRLMALLPTSDRSSGQVIFTSHSPYFIDLFDEHLDGIFVTKPGDTHSQIVKPEQDRLRRILEDFDLGEAHFRGLLA